MEDCCGATSQAAHEAALSRRVKAGAVRTTTIPALLEWQRDWRNREHYDNLMGVNDEGSYGRGPRTREIDLNGRRAIPGLNDSHLHVIRGGLNYNMELRWDGVPSPAGTRPIQSSAVVEDTTRGSTGSSGGEPH